MTYIRPKSDHALSPGEKKDLLQEYFDYYKEIAVSNPDLLNSKLPRSAFNELIDEIGELILKKADLLSSSDNEVSRFLSNNPLPKHLEQYLPNDFRVYSLALNAMKQWLSAEQAATDRYIFGGTVRAQCKKLGKNCLVSGKPADECTIELHHPVRDGRPPIPLAKEAHADIEGQSSITRVQDEIMSVIYPIKRSGNRSWVMLKLGCELLLDIANTNRSINVQSSSKTFARKASEASGLDFKELLQWVETNNLVYL
jgi:hypothetical protein